MQFVASNPDVRESLRQSIVQQQKATTASRKAKAFKVLHSILVGKQATKRNIRISDLEDLDPLLLSYAIGAPYNERMVLSMDEPAVVPNRNPGPQVRLPYALYSIP